MVSKTACPEGMKSMKLIVRGGSIAAGFGVAVGYVDILRTRLASACIEVINRSRHGDTSFDGVSTFDADIESHRPDMLVIHFGVEDAFSCVYRSEFKENLVIMVRRARLRSIPVILLSTSHIFDNRHEMNAVFMYYRTIREVALDLECRLMPLHIAWGGVLADTGLANAEFLQKDQRYPNERGHAVYADILAGALERLLQQGPTSAAPLDASSEVQ